MRPLSLILTNLKITIFLLVYGLAIMKTTAQADHSIVIQLSGIYNSQLSLIPFDGRTFSSPIETRKDIKEGESVELNIPKHLIPGEFIFRFQYRLTTDDEIKTAQKQVIIGEENMEALISPALLNHNKGFTWKNDAENNVWNQFLDQNSSELKQIRLMEQIIDGCTDKQTAFRRKAIKQYTRLIQNHNLGISAKEKLHHSLFASHLFRFYKVIPINWKLSEHERWEQQAFSWIEQLNLSDTLVLRSHLLPETMSSYLNLVAINATSPQSRDSLFVQFGDVACSNAAKMNEPLYEWTIQFFKLFFNSRKIPQGTKMLEKYTN